MLVILVKLPDKMWQFTTIAVAIYQHIKDYYGRVVGRLAKKSFAIVQTDTFFHCTNWHFLPLYKLTLFAIVQTDIFCHCTNWHLLSLYKLTSLAIEQTNTFGDYTKWLKLTPFVLVQTDTALSLYKLTANPYKTRRIWTIVTDFLLVIAGAKLSLFDLTVTI